MSESSSFRSSSYDVVEAKSRRYHATNSSSAGALALALEEAGIPDRAARDRFCRELAKGKRSRLSFPFNPTELGPHLLRTSSPRGFVSFLVLYFFWDGFCEAASVCVPASIVLDPTATPPFERACSPLVAALDHRQNRAQERLETKTGPSSPAPPPPSPMR